MADAPAPDRDRAPYSLVGTGRKEATLPTPPEKSAAQPKSQPYREFTATNADEMQQMLADIIASDLGGHATHKKE